jgi:hypothetical protein
MNTIQQIKLKLQLGFHPAIEISSEIVKDMWQQLLAERAARGRIMTGGDFDWPRETPRREHFTAD